MGLTALVSLLSKGLSRVFPSTIGKHQFFSAQPFLWSSSHISLWEAVETKEVSEFSASVICGLSEVGSRPGFFWTWPCFLQAPMSQWGHHGGCHGHQGTGVGPQAWMPQAPSPASGLPTPGFGSANKMADSWDENPLIYLGLFFFNCYSPELYSYSWK